MKLYYFKDPSMNFGDDLNPWLWNRELPGLFDDDDSSLFVGIGTLLNHRIPRCGKKYVFGSGLGYGALPDIDADWQFICVRGPLTAKELNLPPALAVVDPAVLINRHFPFAEIGKTVGVAFMPHCLSAELGDWAEVCEIAGIEYIDPRQSVEAVMQQLAGAELLLAEAMHGAIAAEAFRIPWVPVVCHDHIATFKWDDWCESLQMEYRPESIQPVFRGDTNPAVTTRLKNRIKRILLDSGIWSSQWAEPPMRRSSHAAVEKAAAKLLSAAESGRPMLSRDRVFFAKLERLEYLLENFRKTFSP